MLTIKFFQANWTRSGHDVFSTIPKLSDGTSAMINPTDRWAKTLHSLLEAASLYGIPTMTSLICRHLSAVTPSALWEPVFPHGRTQKDTVGQVAAN